MAVTPRVLGVHVVPVRLFPLVGVPAAVASARPPGVPVVAADWALALASALLAIGGGTWVWPVAAGQSALLVLAAHTAGVGRYAVQALAAFALLELTMRRTGRSRAIGVALVAGATLANIWQITGGDLLRSVFWSVLITVVPVGFGLHMWSLRLWMVRYHEQLREAERLRESDAIAARATERTAIARELHDLIAHHVASIVLRVGVARHVIADADARVTKVLDDVYATGNTALADLRELVAVLREPAMTTADPHLPPLNPADLPAALGEAAARVTAAGLPVATDIGAGIGRLDAMRRTVVLRLAQEGLTNALKHATGASGACLEVRLVDETGAVEVDVRDDGATDRATEAARPGGHGLIGLAERVELCGGSFRAGPGPAGWLLRAVLPAPDDQGARN